MLLNAVARKVDEKFGSEVSLCNILEIIAITVNIVETQCVSLTGENKKRMEKKW